MQKERLAFINIYKILAAIVIACFLHYRVFLLESFGESFTGDNFLVLFLMGDKSNYFVELFFMMSGLLFAFAYRQRIEEGSLTFATFMNKRLIRLIPLCVITTCWLFPLKIVFERLYGIALWPGFASLNNFIASIFLTNSNLLSVRINPPAWYISKLLICYIIAYVLSKYHKNLGWITYFLPIILGLVIQEEGWNMPLLEFHISRAYIAFFLGVLLEDILKYSNQRKIQNFELCVGVVLLLISYFLRNLVTDWSAVSTVFIFVGMILVGYNSRILNVIGNTKYFKCLGNISFDLYLWNWPLLLVFIYLYMIGVKTNGYTFLLILILIHLVVAYVSAKIREHIRLVSG